MLNKKRIVEFRRRPGLPGLLFPFPVPAVKAIPQWYRDIPMYLNGDTRIKLRPGNSSPKACVPVLDSLSAGYVMLTPHDIQVTTNPNGDPELTAPYQGPSLLKTRDADLADLFPAPLGFTHGRYIWHTAFEAKLPKGYSMLYTHPLNQDNLPFKTASGIMDSDIYGHSGSVPFSVKIGWEGIIPKGTPFVQMIPIKREPWSHENSDIVEDDDRTAIPRVIGRGYYRDHWWQKKEYK
jgi:hypothetical protein